MQSVFYSLRVTFNKIWWWARKLKFVVAGLVVVLIALGIWQYHVHSVNTAWKRATDYYSRADYANAAKQLKHVSMPSDPARLAIYAQTMLATRQLPQAEVAYKKLYSIKHDPFAELVLGNVYNEEKNYPQAVKIYQSLITSNPSYTQAYVNLATVYRLQNNDAAAISTAQKGVMANPKDVILSELLVSMTMNDTSSSAYKTAVANLKQLSPKDPLLEAINQQ